VAYHRGRRYQDKEVRAIVEHYGDVIEDRDTDGRGVKAIIAVADLKNGWKRLNNAEREVLLIRGILNQNVWEAALFMEKSTTWVDKQYNIALTNLTLIMNGDV